MPPSLEDVSNAIKYTVDVALNNTAKLDGCASKEDVARAHVYEVAVKTAYAGAEAAPAWFSPALRSLQRLEKTVAQMWNLQCSDGTQRKYMVVPFQNGEVPTETPHNLPALLTVNDIRSLSRSQGEQYLQGYGRLVPHLTIDRKREIGRAISCPVDI